MNLNTHLTPIAATNTHVISNELLYNLLVSYRDYLVSVYNQYEFDTNVAKENKKKLLDKIRKYNNKIEYLAKKLNNEAT